jgi:hypothetical protein
MEGYFVDWNGEIRTLQTEGMGYTIALTEKQDYTSLEVSDEQGETIYEGVYWSSLEELKAELTNSGADIVFAKV